MVKRTEQWYLKTKEEILKVAESLDVKRMPTYSELNLITGSSSLSRRIMKTGGFRHWSELLDLKLKKCEVIFGKEYEYKAKEKLLTMFKKVELTCERFPYDLLIENKIKVDVKVARKYYVENHYNYIFTTHYKFPKCDFYIFYGIDENEKIEKTLIIPANLFYGSKQIIIGKKSKYDYYDNKWGLLKSFNQCLLDFEEKNNALI